MLIRIEEGKGHKDRGAMLSPELIELPVLHTESPIPGTWASTGSRSCQR
jgi:hypothetical protein